LQTKLSEQPFCLITKWLASAQAGKGKCLWAHCEKCWDSNAHMLAWNLESSHAGLLWTLETSALTSSYRAFIYCFFIRASHSF